MWKNIKTFLPFYTLIWAENMTKKICDPCPLAAYVHPLVEEGKDHYRILCTVNVIRNGLLTLEEVFKDEGSCGDRNDDYMRAKAIFEMVKGIKLHREEIPDEDNSCRVSLLF
jgi:hypothetical protein